MLVSEIIQRIESLYSKGVESDDFRLTPRHIYNKVLTVRNKLISQKSKKRQRISQWNYQTIDCIELIKAEKHECPCIPPKGCAIYRSKYKIPKPLMNMSSPLIDSVSTVDGSTLYNEISWKEAKYKFSNTFTAMKPDYYIRNEYIYVLQRKGASVISITGIFENPFEADNFKSVCDDEECTDCQQCNSPMEMDLPIDDDMIDTLIEMCIQELIVIYSQSMEDTRNNTRDIINNDQN